MLDKKKRLRAFGVSRLKAEDIGAAVKLELEPATFAATSEGFHPVARSHELVDACGLTYSYKCTTTLIDIPRMSIAEEHSIAEGETTAAPVGPCVLTSKNLP
jgi:hypothetical protein